MRKILISLLVIGSVSATAFNLSRAFFSDTETSKANTFTAGAVDLKVGNKSYYNGQLQPNATDSTSWSPTDLTLQKFFNFTDLKPGDWGSDAISLKIDTNDSWACYDLSLSQNDDLNCTEPELLDDPNCNEPNEDVFDGELAQNIHLVIWPDDGDAVLEADEANHIIVQGPVSGIQPSLSGALSDSLNNLFTSQSHDPLAGEQTYHLAKAWCFGDLNLSPLAQDGSGETRTPIGEVAHTGITCQGQNINNATQTDVVVGSIAFSAIQARNNLGYICPHPTPVCSESTVYGYEVVSVSQGMRKNSTPVLTERSDPAKTLGAPEGVVNPPQWFSLGFGGTITLKFQHPVGEGTGNDLAAFEITNGRSSYPEEIATVEVSLDDLTYYPVGTASGKAASGNNVFDISTVPLSTFQFVRLTDISNPVAFEATADGFDLDAISAVYGECQ